MDLSKIEINRNELLNGMKEGGYSESYINMLSKLIDRILDINKDDPTISGFGDIWNVLKNGIPSKYQSKMASRLGVVERFYSSNALPDRKVHKHTGIRRRKSYDSLLPEFRKVVDAAEETLADSGIRNIQGPTAALSVFLHTMQDKGAVSLRDITQNLIVSGYTKEDGKCKYSSTTMHNIKSGLQAATSVSPDEIARITPLIPIPKKDIPEVERLTDEELEKINAYISDKDLCSRRDAAVLSLLEYTSLRASDVGGLLINSIDWESEEINLVQQKTGNLVSIPMLPEVSNSIFVYICEERTPCSSPYLFQKIYIPTESLNRHCIDSIVGKAFKICDIRTGRRGKAHLFRRTVATKMLENDTDISLIASTLGHSSLKTVDRYLGADIAHLRLCSLDISDFPVPEEVFDDAAI